MRKQTFVYDGVLVTYDGKMTITVKGGPKFMDLAVAAELCARLVQGGSISYSMDGGTDGNGLTVKAHPINPKAVVDAIDDMSRRPTPSAIRSSGGGQ